MIPILRYANINRNLKNCYEIFRKRLTYLFGFYFNRASFVKSMSSFIYRINGAPVSFVFSL